VKAHATQQPSSPAAPPDPSKMHKNAILEGSFLEV